MIWRFILNLLFLFDAERVHNLSVACMRFLARFLPKFLQWLTGDRKVKRSLKTRDYSVRVAGVDFWGRVGLAAGFDKNGHLLRAVPYMGFHFSEIGTVTPLAQPGNERPRLFRLAREQAIFNRMGFNNAGCDALIRELQDFSKHKPWYFRLGINLGKNKDTPAELAASDYVLLAENLAEYADYLVVNVSSPNTPGLRDLQTLASLEPIVRSTAGAIRRSQFQRPLFVKIAPELDPDFVQDLASRLPGWGAQGLILTNTLSFEHRGLKGGLSGRPLQSRSCEHLRLLRKKSDIPIISVGGIDSVEEAKRRLDLGADLLQIYSAWIYQGPRFPAELANYLHVNSGKH